jgi:hypothetical protein
MDGPSALVSVRGGVHEVVAAVGSCADMWCSVK